MRLLVIFFLAVAFFSKAQVPVASFDVKSTACSGEILEVKNNSTDAVAYQWDYCANDFYSLASSGDLKTITGLSAAHGYKLVEDNGVWYGFITSRANNKLFRLDFGNSPSNVPSVVDLGNPNNQLAQPEGIDIIKNGNSWYGFVGLLNIGAGVVRLNFGSSLTNTPVATNIGNFGFSSTRFREVKVVKQNLDLVLVLVSYNQNSLIRINYRDSFTNAIGAEHIFNSGAIAGADLPTGVDIVKTGSSWIAVLVSLNNSRILRLNFGSNILSVPSVQGNTVLTGVSRPYRVKLVQKANDFYGIVSNEALSIAIINFKDLAAAHTPQEVLHSGLPTFLGIDATRWQGKGIVHGVTLSDNKLRQLIFEETCNASVNYSSEKLPIDLFYSTPGDKKIELRAYGSNGEWSSFTDGTSISTNIAPVISFTANSVMCVNSAVAFTSEPGTDVISFSWDFGDASGSIDPSPSHLYTSPGRYGVKLLVNSSNGCANTFFKPVVIYTKPIASFAISAEPICTNDLVTFFNTTVDNFEGNLSYQWYVDDLPVSTDRDLQYNFSTTGARTIKLQTSIPGCSDEIEQTTSDVKAGPVVDFSFTGKCEDAEVQFVDNIEEPVTSYSWDFQNGSPSSQDDPVHVFDAPGIYKVTLTALSPNGCNNAATKPVTIYTAPAVDFSVNPPPKSCSGSLTPFTDLTPDPTDSDIATWQWDFGDPGSANNTSPLINPDHTFANAGTYDVSLTVQTDQGCASSTVKNIAIVPSPAATIENTPTCKGLPVNFLASGANISGYYWEVGTVYYEVPDPTHTFNAAGNFPMRLTVTGTNSCQTVYNKIINVPVPLTADFSVTKNCVGSEALFTDLTTGADPVVQRSWDFAGEGTGSGASPAFQFNATGNKLITLQVVSQAGCQYTTAKTIQVSSPPVADFTSLPEPGAATLPVQFTNASTGAIAYSWTFGDGSGTSTLPSPAYSFNAEGEYSVELTAIGAQGCEDRQTKTVTVVTPLPDVDLKLITVTENADGTLKIIVTIHNKGNTLVTALPVVIDISGETTLTETLKEPVLPASQYNLVLNYGINVNDDLKFLCASIDLPNDLTPEGNRICKELGGQVSLFTAYPNPAASTLKIGWVAPGNEVVAIVLVDSFGKKVLERAVSSTEGLNTAVLDISRFRDGIYFLVLNGGSVRSAQRILISGQN